MRKALSQIQRKYRDLIILDYFSRIFYYLKICFDIFIKKNFLKNAMFVDITYSSSIHSDISRIPFIL